jgi:predicted DCC family thiol-disulfide oxidoreductase YuxK
MTEQKPIIFFDGVCHLCNGFVDAIIQRDSKALFQFAPIQGETAEKMLTSEERQNLETVILYQNHKKYHRSEAVLKVLIQLGGAYKVFVLGFALPSFLRDGLYNWIANHRYAWFGQREFCRLPLPEEKDRLLP